jgi:hypothetical protein
VDSGCTVHFLLVNAPSLNKVKSQTPLTVRLPNGATMESSHTAELDIPELNATASKAHVFPGMANHSLLSVGQLCDEGYIVTFKRAVYALRNTGALVHYLHKALFSPTKSAMLQAVKDGHLITWPGSTEDAINTHLKLTPATAMGHLNQRRQNIR